MKIQKVLKDVRLMIGLTQKQLADSLFITQNALSQYENGKRDIPTEILEKVLEMANLEIKLEKKPTYASERLKELIKIEGDLKRKFPTWNIDQSGGGVWILEKDIYSESLGKNVLVKITEDVVVVYRKIDEKTGQPTNDFDLINFETYKEDEQSGKDLYWKHEVESQLAIIYYDEEGFSRKEEAEKVFTNDVLEDFEYIARNIYKD